MRDHEWEFSNYCPIWITDIILNLRDQVYSLHMKQRLRNLLSNSMWKKKDN